MLFHKMSPSEVADKGQNQSVEEQKESLNDNESTKPDTQTKISEFRNNLFCEFMAGRRLAIRSPSLTPLICSIISCGHAP